MDDNSTKDANNKPDDKGGDPGKQDDTGGKLEQFFTKLDSMTDEVKQLGQKVNLIQQNMLSPDYLERGEGKGKPKPKSDEGETKRFEDIPWDDLTNKELVSEIVTEFNKVLKGTAPKESIDEVLERVEDLATDFDVATAIVDIAGEEDCSIKEAHKKFWDLSDNMKELTEKFPNITAKDAYNIASGKTAKPKKPDDKPVDSRKETIRGVVDELRGGGSKPGGPGDLDTKPPADTRSAVTKHYDELFEGK